MEHNVHMGNGVFRMTTINFCGQCGTKTKAMSWPDDDYRCPKKGCIMFNMVVEK